MCFCLAFFHLGPVVAGAYTDRGPFKGQAVSLTVYNERITAHLEREPLIDILSQLARHFGFQLHVHDSISNELISSDFQDASLQEALEKLLVSQDYAIVKSGLFQRQSSSRTNLGKLFVLPRGAGSQSSNYQNLKPYVAIEEANPSGPVSVSEDRKHEIDPVTMEKLEEVLLNSDDPFLREDAADVLADYYSPEAGHTLSQALLQDLDEFVRVKAAKALGESWDPQHLGTLTEALFKDSHADVRATAAEALGELGELKAIPALQKALDDSSPKVRESAVEALGDFAEPQSISLLRRALADPSNDVRRNAAYQLERLKGVQP